ncbi:MAG TPA: hypothetical protein VEH04_08775 [Verrucomicrobiae bacterium]|nr:hypothetical protein [Verrucomicrobiae bacterium]
MIALKQLIEAPESDASTLYETLAYVDGFDAVQNCDYAFVAYKETCRDSGNWRVRIRSSQTAGAVFEPGIIQSTARSIAAQGRPWFLWGYSFDPSPGDPRKIQFRVHVSDGEPAKIEMLVQLRNFDGTADGLRSVKFAWPN